MIIGKKGIRNNFCYGELQLLSIIALIVVELLQRIKPRLDFLLTHLHFFCLCWFELWFWTELRHHYKIREECTSFVVVKGERNVFKAAGWAGAEDSSHQKRSQSLHPLDHLQGRQGRKVQGPTRSPKRPPHEVPYDVLPLIAIRRRTAPFAFGFISEFKNYNVYTEVCKFLRNFVLDDKRNFVFKISRWRNVLTYARTSKF